MANSRKAEPDLGGAIAASLARHLPSGGRLTVGYSGGLDSTVLLHALASLSRGGFNYTLAAVHVHHGLSPMADQWADHCHAFCLGLGIPLQVNRVRVTPAGDGLEAAARKARYQIYESIETDVVLLAHHRDDQAETVLLQMMRGATVRGMAAMPEARTLSEDKLLMRPLLAFTRDQLESYAHHHALPWVEDESNQDPSLARNHVRHILLPRLDVAMPGLAGTLARMADQCAEWADLLDSLADQDGAGISKEVGLSVEQLRAMPDIRARNLLRRFLERHDAQVRRPALIEALRQVRDAREGATVRVDFGRHSLVRHGGHLHVVPRNIFGPVPELGLTWSGETKMDLGSAGRLFLEKGGEGGMALSEAKFLIRHRLPGDQVFYRSGKVRRSLKDVLREAGIPPWQRPWLPVLEADGQILWVAGLGAMDQAIAPVGSPGWIISWEPPW